MHTQVRKLLLCKTHSWFLDVDQKEQRVCGLSPLSSSSWIFPSSVRVHFGLLFWQEGGKFSGPEFSMANLCGFPVLPLTR